jgi:bacterioferritin-associated ferredoxin
MYVCICNGYREREVREAASCGARTVEEAYARLGDAPCCGCCVPFAQAIIDETLCRPAAAPAFAHLHAVAE